MSDRPQAAPRKPEPSHAEILQGLAVLSAATTARFDAIDRETGHIRKRVDAMTGDVGGLKSDVGALKSDMNTVKNDVAALKLRPAATPGGEPQEHDGGLPFRYGWRSWLVVGVAVLTGLGALKAALLAMDAAGAAIVAAWQSFTHH